MATEVPIALQVGKEVLGALPLPSVAMEPSLKDVSLCLAWRSRPLLLSLPPPYTLALRFGLSSLAPRGSGGEAPCAMEWEEEGGESPPKTL